MGLIEQIGGKRICLDTAPVIYFIEEHKRYLDIIEPVFQAIEQGEVEAVTSTVTPRCAPPVDPPGVLRASGQVYTLQGRER